MAIDSSPLTSDSDADAQIAALAEVQDLFDHGIEISTLSPQNARNIFHKVLTMDDRYKQLGKLKEDALVHLGHLYKNDHQEFRRFFHEIRPFIASLPKARTAKLVRTLIEMVPLEDDYALETHAQMCQEAIAWCIEEKRTFLKQRIQTRLGAVYLRQKKYNDVLELLRKLVRDVKRFDDKQLLVELFLLESRVHLALANVPKAKGAMTAARSSANAIYCPPTLQAEIDIHAGILSAAENDFKTAFSYFYESFEGYNTIKNSVSAIKGLKYMLLSKIMLSQYEDVYSIINGKAGVKYAGIDMEAMRAVADAYKQRSIEQLDTVFQTYARQLTEDPIISSHLNELKDQLLEANLIRLLEPFSRVQIEHVARLIKLPLLLVEGKLSEMILDKKLHGILDQGAGDLILFETATEDSTYQKAIETVLSLHSVVDHLNRKTKALAV